MSGKPHDDGNLARTFNYTMANVVIVSNDGNAYEIGEYMVEMNIYEDIHKNAVTGTLVMLDPVNLIGKLPLQGIERLMFKLSTPGTGDGENLVVDATETTGYPFHIYKLTDRVQVSETVESYVLHFCSREMFRNLRTRESRAYDGNLDTSAMAIFANKSSLDGRKKFKVEPTRNQDKLVMPNIRPFDALNMLASRALCKNGKSAGYLFYETTKAFYFRSIENMFASQTTFARDEEVELNFSPKNIGAGRGKGDSLEFNKSVLSDVVESIIGSIYLDTGYNSSKNFIINEIIDIDIINSEPTKHPKSLLQEYCLNKYDVGKIDNFLFYKIIELCI